MSNPPRRFPSIGRQMLLILVTVACAIVLAGYCAFSLFAMRPLSLSEYRVFGSACLRAALGHAGENGGRWALHLAAAVLSAPVAEAALAVGSLRYEVPLPPYTSPLEGRARTYVTFASTEQLAIYYSATLPQAGWRVEQLGGLRSLRHPTAGRATIVQSYYCAVVCPEQG